MKYTLFGLWLGIISCSVPASVYDPQEVIDSSIQAHGMNLLNKKVSFDFRDKVYSVTRKKGTFVYTRHWQDDSLGHVEDVLINSSEFTRFINDDIVGLSAEWVKKYANSVNSVLYFTQVPLVLNDHGAIKKFLGEVEMKGQKYIGVQVTFQEDGGGEDHEDVFIYWIHSENRTVDFFAYSYLTNGGGIRFREAINRREIKGIIFQDYINYKAETVTSLASLPKLFERGELNELSIIENENIKVTSLN